MNKFLYAVKGMTGKERENARSAIYFARKQLHTELAYLEREAKRQANKNRMSSC